MQRKALYNLLRFTSNNNKSLNVQKWQIEDLRVLSEETLFKKLSKLDFNLDKNNFVSFAKEVESPEELASVLAEDRELEEQDQTYLVVFEMWRRFLSDKRTISIFCDELDYRIFQYDNNLLENDEHIQNALDHLKNILDSNVDLGISKKEAFQNILKYIAHDLENFLYDYISELIEFENYSYALDLLDSFYEYVEKKVWFDFLNAKLIAKSDVSKCNEILINLFSKLKEKPVLDLQIRILNFMVKIGDRKLFLNIVKETLKIMSFEKDFKKVLNIVADYYLRLDQDEMEAKITKIMDRRAKIKEDEEIKKKDKDLLDFSFLIFEK